METLPIALAGLDFRRASSRWRSRAVLDEKDRRDLVAELARTCSVDGFVDLTTCNRVEWIASTPEPAWTAQVLRAALLERLESEGENRSPDPAADRLEPYVYTGREAARHVLSVGIGLESFVVGERQIATQLFRALEGARGRGESSRVLNGLGSISGRLVRDAVKCGCIGGPASGVHWLAFRYVAEWLSGREAAGKPAIAIVGLGAIGRLVRGLVEQDPRFVAVPVNRTVPRGETARVVPLRELGRVLADVDAAIVCTSAPHKVVKGSTLAGRDSSRPMLVLDIGIPEQVDTLDPSLGATRAGLDDLISDPGHAPDPAEQQKHAQMAADLLVRSLDEFDSFVHEGSVVDVLDEVRRRHDRFVDEEIPRCIEERASGLDESSRAHLVFALKGMVLGFTNDIFRAIKKSQREGDRGSDDWNETP